MQYSSILLSCFVGIILTAPVKHTVSDAELKKRLGPNYDTYTKLEADLKLMYVKELDSVPEGEKDRVHKRWREITRRHIPAHTPGSFEQLHEAWRDDDQMDDDSYSPQALFMTHDFDNDGFLSGPEIRALYYSQLERIYPDHNNAEDTVRGIEDLRMYSRLLELMDRNNDGKISLEEFKSYRPDHDDDEYDWIDEDDLPDLDHIQGDKVLESAILRDLEKHPDDKISEDLMHRISGKEAITEKPTIKSYSIPQEHQTESQHAKPVAAHVPSQNTSSTDSPQPN